MLQEESYYKDGKRHGLAKWFDKDGVPTIQYEYKDGELVKM
jgi:antitoxin component YwqK of YwqJK toxin-antitoxin module